MASGSVPPGWYADPAGVAGRWRWWDGQRWTEAVRDAADPAAAESAAEAGDGAAAAGRGRWWLVAAVVVALVVVGGGAVVVVAGSSSSDEAGGGAADEVSAQADGEGEGAGQAEGEAEERGEPDAGHEGAASAEDADDGEALQGMIRDAEREPVEGVEVLVVDDDGVEVGLGVTDDEGQWFVPLPGPGSYTATLVEQSLPPDVGLRDPDRASLDVDVRSEQQRSVVFALG